MAAQIQIPRNIAGLSISEAYENDNCFEFLLGRTAIAANEIARLNNEGFTNMKSLVDIVQRFELQTLKFLHKKESNLSKRRLEL